MKKIVRLTESELIHFIKNIISESNSFDDIPSEEDDLFSDDDEFIDEFEPEDTEFDDDEEFQNRMRLKYKMKSHRPQSVGVGGSTRWDKDTEREVEKGGWSPIKATDTPLEKYLSLKNKD